MSIFKKLAKRHKKLGLDEEDRPETFNIKSKVQRVDEQDSDANTSEEDEAAGDQQVIDASSSSQGGSQQDGSVQEDAEKEEQDPEDELNAFADAEPHSKEWKNRQRVLMTAQRGIEGRLRHLMNDLTLFIPHCKKEGKVERKKVKEQIDDLCFERSCNNFMYFEQRSHKMNDLFLWISKSPNGPAFKFSVQNIHTMSELKLSGNCLRYSRPFLSFDGAFEDAKQPHLQLAKELLSHVFNTPKNHPKSKPFIDHVISFTYCDGRIWFRNYQILNQHEEKFTAKDDIDKLVLIEIGPRFTLNPIKAFQGSMGGEALWQNSAYIAPAKIRSKKYANFAKKRDEKSIAKEYHDEVIKEGKDPESYLQEAFDSESSN